MKHLFYFLAVIALLAAPAAAQTVKTLSYNTTNSTVIWTNTNTLTFSDAIQIAGNGTIKIDGQAMYWEGVKKADLETMQFYSVGNGALALELSYENGPNISYYPLDFGGTNAALHAAQTRTNLGLGATWLTNDNVTNFRTAIGLGVSNAVRFEQLFATDTVEIGSSTNTVQITTEAIEFGHSGIAAQTRTNLGLGWPALTNSNAATSLLGYAANGQVVANTGTNVLTFTNVVKIADGTNTDSLTITNGRKISYMGDQSYINLEEMSFYPTISVLEGTNSLQISASASQTRTNLGFAFVLRTNSTSRASTTSLADDEALAYSFPSSGNYFVTLSHLMVVDTNTGLKVRMVGTNATVRGTWSFGAVQATNEHSVSLAGVSGTRMFHQWFVVDASANASIVFQWAQQTSGTNATQILPGSFLRIERMD